MFSEILEQGRILMSMVGCTFIAIGSERRKSGRISVDNDKE